MAARHWRKADAAKLTTSVSVQTSSAGQTSQTSSTITSSQAPLLTVQSVAAQGSSQVVEQRSVGEEGGGRGMSLATPTTHEDQAADTSFLEATHESLIPLEEEEDEEGEREQHREIISLAHELGRQRREELSAAGPGDKTEQRVTYWYIHIACSYVLLLHNSIAQSLMCALPSCSQRIFKAVTCQLCLPVEALFPPQQHPHTCLSLFSGICQIS